MDDLAYLQPLNPEQKQAVLHTGKPLLILAGAGSGKTRVITTKIAYLIGERGMDPRSILAVTFTNKAAREMEERARQIDPRAEGAMLRTFHSFGAWFLRRNGSLAGLDSSFVIYDDNDVISLLSTLMENSNKQEVRQFAHNISRAKDYFLNPNDPLLAAIDDRKKFRTVYSGYEERMAQIGNVDFGDLIKKPVEILRSKPEVAQRFRDRFKVIMVDEYQDANVAQFHLLKELCGADTYVCVVGDDDQSIYRFRGAEVKNILEFPQRFSSADIIRLERNYRSTEPILKAASSVVDYNKGRLGKELRAEKGKGSLPILAYLPNQDSEALYCAEKIENSVKKKQTLWSDWAILYRTNAQSLFFETLFLRLGIPYRVVGSLKFYEREEIKDALALLAFLINPRDEVAFRRIVNKPTRGVGAATIDKIVEASAYHNGNLIDACGSLELSKKADKGLDEFFNVISEGKAMLSHSNESTSKNLPDNLVQLNKDDTTQVNKSKQKKNKPPKDKTLRITSNGELKAGEGLSVCVMQLVNDSKIAEYHRENDEIAGNNRINNLQELVNAASDYPLSCEGLLEFLENIELDRSLDKEKDAGNQQNAVTLITFHNTKGLEFKCVIMTGLDHGVFPREDKKDDDLEEERRLFYVGATRAMDELYLTTCKERRMYGRTMPVQPSLFLREIDRNFLHIDNRYAKSAAAPRPEYNPYQFGKYNNKPVFPNQINFAGGKNSKVSTGRPSISEIEERSGWRRGQRLFHDAHGYGAVTDVKDSDEGPIVQVNFDNGDVKRFLSDIQGGSYEKINDG